MQMQQNEESLKPFRLRYDKHIAQILGISLERLRELADNAERYYREFDRVVKGKERRLVEATGLLKVVQRRTLDRILMRIPPFEGAYGAIKGKSIKENAQEHARSQHILKLDIRSFYPSIHRKKVYKFFFMEQKCSPDVAKLLTELTTRKHSLPLGTSTSPMLADLIVRGIDMRIQGMATKAGLKYTRYVDDITISGGFSLEEFKPLLIRILKQSGFRVKNQKIVSYGPNDRERIITGAAVRNCKVTVPNDYVQQLETKLKDAAYWSKKSVVEQDFETKEHYRGQIGYVLWLDKKIGQRLFGLYRKVRWKHLEWLCRKVENHCNNLCFSCCRQNVYNWS
jgi:RNA-directed DNA polymerase